MSEYILENCTTEEIDKLEKSDIEWYPDELTGNDVCIYGTTEDFEKALKIIGREERKE